MLQPARADLEGVFRRRPILLHRNWPLLFCRFSLGAAPISKSFVLLPSEARLYGKGWHDRSRCKTRPQERGGEQNIGASGPQGLPVQKTLIEDHIDRGGSE